MSALTLDDQLKFALACFHNSNPGKIDWKTVASECNIVTPGAAQKRWERLNKANGLPSSVSSGAGGSGDPTTPVKKEKAKAKPTPKAGGSAAKKRKIQQVVKDEAQGADEKTMKSRHHSDEDDAEAFIKDEA